VLSYSVSPLLCFSQDFFLAFKIFIAPENEVEQMNIDSVFYRCQFISSCGVPFASYFNSSMSAKGETFYFSAGLGKLQR
jgi:hypothetical protein